MTPPIKRTAQRTPGKNRRSLDGLLKIKHLRIIAELSERGIVSEIAKSMNLTQPAISKQIAEVEKALDVPIIHRERNRLFLTPIGERLAFHAHSILQQIKRAEFDIDAMCKGLSGHIGVGTVTSLAPLILPNAISMLKQTAPLASVSVVEGHFVTLLPRLQSGEIDMLLARTWQPEEIDGIHQMTIASEPISVVTGRDHPLAKRKDIDWEDATEWPWILPQSGSVARHAIDAFFSRHGLRAPVNVIESVSLSLNLELLRTMPVLGLFPEHLAFAHAMRVDLVILPLTMDGTLSEARCFWREGQLDANGTLELFLSCLIEARQQSQGIR